jgi:hypothetical protein
MTIRTPFFLRSALLFVPILAGASECRNWQAVVLPSDRPSVQVAIDTLVGMLPAQPVDTHPEFVADQTQALNEARNLLESARHALPLGDITGAWRVASIQVGRTGGFSYSYFVGRIERTACGYRFTKTQGSQRSRAGLSRRQHGQRKYRQALWAWQPAHGTAVWAGGAGQFDRPSAPDWSRYLADDPGCR